MLALIHLHGVAECTRGARHNGNLGDRRGVGLLGSHQCVTDLVVRNNLLLLGAEHGVLALRTGNDGLYALIQIGLNDAVASKTNGTQSRLVDDVGEVSTGRTRSCTGNRDKVDIAGHVNVLSVHLQNCDTTLQIGQLHWNAAIKTARTQQSRVKRLRTVGRRQNNDALGAVKAVHLGQQLVERLLALVVAAHARAVALFADGVDLIDEHDARCFFAGLLEQIAHLGRAHADEHFDELRAGDGEERHMRFTGNGLRQQGLAGTRRADQQCALRQLCTDGSVLVRVVQEVYDLGEGLLGLILTGDISKGLAGLGLGVNLGVGFAEAHHVAAHVLHHLFLQPLTDRDNEHNWHNVADEHAQQGRGLGRDLSGKLNIGPQQTADQLVIREDASLVECVLALVVLGLEGDLLVLLVISDGLDLTLVHHGDELVVADLGHLPLQQARKQQPVEHHKHEQHDSIIEDQRFFGIFCPVGVVIHVSFVLSSKSLRFRCIFCITLHRVCISCSEIPCCSVSAKVSQR